MYGLVYRIYTCVSTDTVVCVGCTVYTEMFVGEIFRGLNFCG